MLKCAGLCLLMGNILLSPTSKSWCLLCWRCEIEATLERLKKLERDLSTKEQELKERERRLKMWERKLIEQSNTPVSLSWSGIHFDLPSTFLGSKNKGAEYKSHAFQFLRECFCNTSQIIYYFDVDMLWSKLQETSNDDQICLKPSTCGHYGCHVLWALCSGCIVPCCAETAMWACCLEKSRLLWWSDILLTLRLANLFGMWWSAVVETHFLTWVRKVQAVSFFFLFYPTDLGSKQRKEEFVGWLFYLFYYFREILHSK